MSEIASADMDGAAATTKKPDDRTTRSTSGTNTSKSPVGEESTSTATSAAKTSGSYQSPSSQTRSSAQNSAQSVAAASSASSSAATPSVASQATSKGSNTGLIAGVAVLAVLLAIALAAVAFLIFRNKRKNSRRSQYEPSYEQKTPLDPSSAVGLETLESDVKTRDNKIRELQAALLKQGRGGTDLDDRHVRHRFTALSQSINDWVMTNFKGQSFHGPVSPRTVGILQKIAPNYDQFLQDPRMKYLVIRAIVIENIAEAIMANQFLGSIPFVELKHGFNRHAPQDKIDEWRALTVGLLQTMPDFGREKAASVQEVATRIDSMTSEIARGMGTSSARAKNLQTIVDTAAELSVDLGKQQASYIIGSDQVGGTFDGESMEDVSQSQAGRGRAVQAIVFPSLKKVDQPGSQVTVISRAQVVI